MECIHRRPKGWELCPKHILDLICEKLESTRNALHFGAVCPEWYSILKHGRWKSVHQRQIPMLLFPGKGGTTIYNTTTNEFLKSKLSVPRDKRFIGSSNGWLLAVDRYMNVTIYKPFSMLKGDYIDPKYTIHLPRLVSAYVKGEDIDKPIVDDDGRPYEHLVRNVLITSDPIENPENCVIFLIVDSELIVFYRLNKDKSWRLINYNSYMDNFVPHDLIIHKNMLYVLSYHGTLLSIDLYCLRTLRLELVQEIPEAKYDFPEFASRNFVISNNGSFWCVERVLECTFYDNGRSLVVTRSFRILELDFERREWIQLDSIGDSALFMGQTSCICVNASDFIGCRRDCIYFTRDICSYGTRPHNDIGLCDIQSGKIVFRFTTDPTIQLRMAIRQPLWVMPTLCFDKKCERAFAREMDGEMDQIAPSF